MNRTSGTSWLINVFVIVVLCFLLVPLLVIVPISFSSASTFDFPPPGFSLKWYREVWASGVFTESFLLSANVALMSTAISLLLGTMASFALVKLSRAWQGIGTAVFTAPLIFPHLIYGMAMLFFLSSIGYTRTYTGFVLAHVVVTLPYIVRSVSASLAGMDKHYEEAAMNLGAGPWQTFRFVTLPLLKPGLFAGGAFSFIVSFDEFSTSLFLSTPDRVTLPVKIFNHVEQIVEPSVAAISTLLIVLSVVVIVAIDRTVGLENFFRNR